MNFQVLYNSPVVDTNYGIGTILLNIPTGTYTVNYVPPNPIIGMISPYWIGGNNGQHNININNPTSETIIAVKQLHQAGKINLRCKKCREYGHISLDCPK